MPVHDDSRPVLAMILARVVECVRQGSMPVVVYDLDSTLFNTGGRNKAIFLSFCDDYCHKFPALADFGERADEVAGSWNIVEQLQSMGFEEREGLNELRGYWADRFFTDQWLGHDFPYAGAAHFVRESHARGSFVYYMTGRHVNGMHLGTVDNLVRDSFPCFESRVSIHLKPSFEMADHKFKRAALEGVRSMYGQVVATFENEPGNSNLFLEHFPTAINVLVDTVHSPNAPQPEPGVYVIPDFSPGTDWTRF